MLKKLKDECYIVMGQSPSSTNYNQDKNGTPFMQGRKTFGDKYPTIDTWTTKLTKIAPKGSVLMSVRAPVGDVNVAPCDLCIGRGLASIKMKNGNNQYLYYLLKNNSELLKNRSTGTVFDAINKEDLENIVLDFHDEKDQAKISEILNNIDKKINLNNKINDNLFELLKLNFRNKFYNKDGKNSYLSDFISETIGGDWGKESPEGNNNTKVYCVRGADIPNMEYGNKGNAPIRYILEKNYRSKKLDPNNIIIEISGGSPIQSTGRSAYITQNILDMYDSPLLCTNFCRAIETRDELLAPFVYMNLKLMYEDNIFFNWENGTTGIKNLALNDMLSNIEVKQPDKDDLKAYNLLFNNFMNKISHNSNENIKLEQLRDTLLPKIMNGEIDLNNVEI